MGTVQSITEAVPFCAHRAQLKCEFQVCGELEVVCMGVSLQGGSVAAKGISAKAEVFITGVTVSL